MTMENNFASAARNHRHCRRERGRGMCVHGEGDELRSAQLLEPTLRGERGDACAGDEGDDDLV